MTLPNLDLRFTAGAATLDLSIPASGGALYDPYRPRYTLPEQVQYNALTQRCELRPEVVTRIAYLTNRPTVVVDVAGTGTVAGNEAALLAAINNAKAANGTASVHALRRIRLYPTIDYGTGYDLDVALFDENGIGCHLYLESTVANTALRAEGQRVGRDDESIMPKFHLKNYNVPAFMLAKTCRRVRFVGLWFDIDPASLTALRAQYGRTGITDPTPFTYNGHITFNYTIFDAGLGRYVRQDNTPFDITIDRCVLTGDDDVRMRRLVYADIDRFVLRDSYLECACDYELNPDSQLVTCIASHGDHVLLNNGFYGCHGENVAYAGDPSFAPEYNNSHLVFFENDFATLDRWDPAHRNFFHKCLLEWKHANFVCVQGNRFRNLYGYGRLGNQFHAIVPKCSDQFTGEAWVRTSNITIMHNLFSRVCGTFDFLGWQSNPQATFKAMYRVEFSFNCTLPWDQTEFGLGFTRPSQVHVGRAGTVDGDDERFRLTDVAIRYNTLWGCDKPNPPVGEPAYNWFLTFESTEEAPVLIRYDVSNNLFVGPNPFPTWPIQFNSALGSTDVATGWSRYVKNGTTFAGNHLQGIPNQALLDGSIGSSNKGYASAAALLVDPVTLVPQAGSPLINASTDGLTVGGNRTLLAAITARSLTGRN